jgi:beta-galactosidase
MREVICLNQDWFYLPKNKTDAVHRDCDESKFDSICLPHPNVELPWHSFEDTEYQFISWYRRHLTTLKKWKGKRLLLTFEGVMIAAKVWVNEKEVGEHKGGYTPFTFDITDYVTLGEDNLISVRVDSRERKDIPPYGGVVDYLTFGGIYRDVTLTVVDPIFVDHVFAKPSKKNLQVEVAVTNRHDAARETNVSIRLGDATAAETILIEPGETMTVTLKMKGLAVKPWSIEDPKLYDLQVCLDNGDAVAERIGFREALFSKNGKFYLNGTPVKLRGLDRHQTYAYVGGAMPARVQRRDADILKYELGLNIVRTSHYPQSKDFLARCDEIGLLVFEELPGWQHIGDDEWKAVSKQELREMIIRDRNHASIILWGVRINESGDDHDFYLDTNKIAHELDPTRQTGGVRYFQESEFLEDVFTYNDFSNGVQDPKNLPHLITEFNGHMFPTKPFDQEERMIEHALRHARIQDGAAGHKQITGAIGWCAFDYNTHIGFGSGDHICYHGVMDIFRFPKFAAHFYKSQQDPKSQVVLEVASWITQGDRSGSGIEPVHIFSNCDTVEAYIGGNLRGEAKPDRENFPNLPHPPFVIHGLSQWPWEADYEFIGKIKGQVVIRKMISGDGVPKALHLFSDDSVLKADGSDCTRVGFYVADQYGNFLPYHTGVVEFDVEGPGTLVGESPFALVGGRGAVYLRAGRKRGMVTISASTPRLKQKTIEISIR